MPSRNSPTRTLPLRRLVQLAVALILTGCQAYPHRPDFMARSTEDCAHGDRLACWMLDALRVPAADTDDQMGSRSPTKVQAGAIDTDDIDKAQPHASAHRWDPRF